MTDGCTICLDEYDQSPDETFIGFVIKCGHYFHFECIWEWLEFNRSCPICREACQIKITDIRGISLREVQQLAHTDARDFDNQAFVSDNTETPNTADEGVLEVPPQPDSPSLAVGSQFALTLCVDKTVKTDEALPAENSHSETSADAPEPAKAVESEGSRSRSDSPSSPAVVMPNISRSNSGLSAGDAMVEFPHVLVLRPDILSDLPSVHRNPTDPHATSEG